MIFKRHDAVVVKDIEPLNRIMPYIMYQKCDSCNITLETVDCAPLDRYIKEKKEEGIEYTYMDLVVAAMIRTIYHLPLLKRYVVNGRIYERKKIACSVAVHRTLRDESAESTVKVEFEGNETLAQISEKFNSSIRKEIFETQENGLDNLVKIIMSIPAFIVKGVVNFLLWMDRHNILPKAICDFSPFHTTFWITNLKSLGIGTIFHHLANFGTASEFVSLGKEKYVASVTGRNKMEIKKVLELGFVLDERICDGLYYARATKMMHRLLANPAVMEEPPVIKKRG